MARLTLNGMFQYDPTLFDGMILPEDYDRDALLAEIMTRCGQLYPYHQVPAILKSNIRLWFSRNFLQFDRIMEALNAEYNPVENYDRHEEWKRTPDLTDEAKHTGKDTLQLSGKDTDQASGTDTLQLSGKDTQEASGKDTDQLSGTDTTTRTHTNYNETSTRTGTDTVEKSVSAFDSSSYQPSEKTVETFGSLADSKNITGSYADATAYGKKDETTYGKKDETTYGRKDETTYGRKDETTYGRKDEQSYDSTVTDRHTGTEEYENYTHGNIGIRSAQELIQQSLELSKYDVYVDIAGRFEHEFIAQVY